ncbi:unnamed protein product [Rhizophagus irregularis]|nr:unnamed protein product [Rhizophagus irregularis]
MTTREILKSHQTQISPIWRAEAERVLWKRYEKAEEVYKQAADVFKKAEMDYWQDFSDGDKNHNKLTNVFAKAYQEKNTRFEEIIAIFRDMLRCGFVTKESNKVEYLWIRVNTQMFKDGIIPATSLAKDLGLDLIDIYGIRKWEAIKASPLNDPDIKRHKEAEEAYDQAVDHYREAVDDFNEADQKKYTRFAGMVVIERALLRCGFVTQESDWKKWTQKTYNIQLLKEGRTLDDSDDDSDDNSDDSDDEE